MPTRRLLAACVLVALCADARAEIDTSRYLPLSELRPGMTGYGRTTLSGADIVEFGVEVKAILRDYGPKQSVILVRCHGADLEQTGIIAGMSGSPVYIGRRLVGAVAFAFPWGKLPIAGVQPIEQMLEVTDRHPWADDTEATVVAAPQAEVDVLARLAAATRPAAEADPAAPAPGDGPVGGDPLRMKPLATPVMVSGAPGRLMDRFRTALAPFGLVPMQGGGAAPPSPGAEKARLVPGACIGVVLMRGDMDISGMGTVTEVVGDRVYAFGHPMFGLGKADYPMTTGIAHLVIPSLANSFRLGAPVEEVGRLTWDASAAVFGRLTDARAPMIPVRMTVHGPDAGTTRAYRYEIIRHRLFSPLLVDMAAVSSLEAESALPMEHTVRYRIVVDAEGIDPIVRENVTDSYYGGGYYVAAQARSLASLLAENPFANLDVTAVEIEATLEAEARVASILEVALDRHAVRPGDTVRARVKMRPLRGEPEWLTVPVVIPETYPEGSYTLTLCGGDAALQAAAAENPGRFRARDLESLVRLLREERPRDRLYVRLERPGQGLTIEGRELPNLPDSMRSILSGAARAEVLPVRAARVESLPMPRVVAGSASASVTVDRDAPTP